MLTMLIIDDEYLVRMCIKKTIEWDKYGVEIIGEAGNGKLGLEMALKYHPDIIITDIRMPFLNGLEFMEKLRAGGLDSCVIVLSGFEEFDYVRTALNNGAFAYLLKPIDNQQLIDIVRKAAQKVKEERSTKQYFERLKKELSSIRKQFLFDLISGNIVNKDEINEKIKFLDIPIDIYNNIVIVIKINEWENNSHELQNEDTKHSIEAIQTHISQLLLLHSKFIGVVLEMSPVEQVVLLHMNSGKAEIIDIIKDRCLELAKRIKGELNLTVSIGISEPCISIEKICRAYSEAGRASEYELLSTSNNVAYIGDNDISGYRREVRDAIKYIKENYNKDISIDIVAKELFISSSHLMYLLKTETEKTFTECLTDYRMQIAKDLLENSNYKIYEISEMVGYKDFRYFSQIFKKATGSNPSDYKVIGKR